MSLSFKTEAGLLKLSIAGALTFGVLGTVWGILISSDGIVFDGFYSFLSTLLSVGSLYVSKLITQKDSDNFQFGKFQFEPLFLVFRSTILITLCSYACLTSINNIFDGGNEVTPGSAIIYAIISIVGCLIIFIVLARKGKEVKSEILAVETLQWKIDTFLSLGVLASYLAYFVLKDGRYESVVPYIDPTLVILLSITVIGTPVKTLVKNFKEVIMAAPMDDVEKRFNKVAAYVVKFYGFKSKKVRVIRTGRTYFAEVNILVDPSWEFSSVRDLDMIRNQFYDQVAKNDLQPWVTFSFTSEKKWL